MMDNFAGQSLHEPLSSSDPSEIRLIKLFPGNLNDEVRCELHHISLSDQKAPPFAALSYTWGSPNGTITIQLNGRSYPVTTNLHSFLRHMQSILLAIAEWLPPRLREPDHNSSMLRFRIVSIILRDMNLPRDFPLESSAMEDIVGRHCRGFASTCRLQQLDHLAEFFDDSDDGDGSDGGYDDDFRTPPATECYVNFWVDAVCINQHDQNEKSKQVSRIRDIYSQAPTVLIWLGDAVASDTEAITAVFRLIRDISSASDLRGRPLFEHFSSENFVSSMLDDMLKVHDIMSASWFSRMWIIQEVVSASDNPIALLGFQPISWMFLSDVLSNICEFMAGFSGIRGLTIMFNGSMKNLHTLQKLTRQYRDLMARRDSNRPSSDEAIASRLNILLQHTSGGFKATDPRDLLYALIGLLGTNSIPTAITPDYSRPIGQVFHQYAVYLARNSCDILKFLSFIKWELPHDVPTWIPDWRFVNLKAPDESVLNERAHAGSASLEVSGDGMRLEVNGRVLGHVSSVVFPTLSALRMRVTGWGEDAERILLPFRVHRAMKSYKTMCSSSWAASVLISNNLDQEDSLQRKWERLWDPSGSGKRLFDILEQDDELEMFKISEEGYDGALTSLRIAINHHAKSGLAILDCAQLVGSFREDEPLRIRDVVCLLQGKSEPCILRQSESFYRFVGISNMSSFPVDTIQRAYAGCPVERFTIV